MNTITQLKTKEGNSTGLIAVKVPKEAEDFELHDGYITYKVGSGTDSFDILRQTLPANNSDFNLIGGVSSEWVNPNVPAQLIADTANYWSDKDVYELLAVNNLYWVNPMGEAMPDQMNVVINVRSGYTFGCCGQPNRDGSCCGNSIPVEYEEPYQDVEVNPKFEQWQTFESNLLADSNLLILKKL